MEQKKQKLFCTAMQKSRLLDFICENKELTKGTFSLKFPLTEAKRLWREISMKLNMLPGASKQWKSWRKVWHDMKSLTKKKYYENKELNELEKRIVALISTENDMIDSSFAKSIVSVSTDESMEKIDTEEGIFPSKPSIENEKETICNFALFDEVNLPQQFTPTTKKRKKTSRATERLQQALTMVSDNFAESCSKIVEMEENYYKKKLKIMQETARYKERIALAAERNATAQERIAAAQEKANQLKLK